MQVKEIVNPKSAEFLQAMEIYSSAFPENERRPVRDTARLLGDSYRLLVAADNNNACMGFMLVYKFGSFVLLDYMAVRDGLRGKGIGAKMLDHVKERFLTGPCKMIVLEVQHADRSQNGAARMRFYQRCGAVLITDKYLMPGYGIGSEETMNLMAIFADPHVANSTNWLDDVVFQIYVKVYGKPVALASNICQSRIK